MKEISQKLRLILDSVLADPDGWLDTPNPQFGGRKPIELVGTEEETKIIDLLHAVEQGLF